MQTNTAEIGNQPVSFSSFSVEKKTYKPDPFTVKDGRSVGSDGFVVPNDFAEFFKRFPDYVQRWVSKHAPTSASEEDKEDWTHDLLMHLSRLPLTSKYREAGKEDIVATFDPLRHYGANEARFRNYINRCLANKFRTMHSKRMKDALCRPGNLSFGTQSEREDLGTVDDEYCNFHSAYLQSATNAAEKQAGDGEFLQAFVNFVRREDPLVLPMIEALLATGTLGDAVDWLGITQSEFGRMRGRLAQLAKCFLSGEPVPRERRPYKKRIARTNQCQFPTPRLAA